MTVIKVADVGVDVREEAEVFDTEKEYMTIFQTGEITMTGKANIVTTINHNLGYPPFCWIYLDEEDVAFLGGKYYTKRTINSVGNIGPVGGGNFPSDEGNGEQSGAGIADFFATDQNVTFICTGRARLVYKFIIFKNSLL